MSNSKFARKGCRECYACVRVCPADAIVIKDGQADILALSSGKNEYKFSKGVYKKW